MTKEIMLLWSVNVIF